jgi:beta-glucosidase
MTNEEKASLLSGRDIWNTRGVSRLNIPIITLADGPTGLRKQAKSSDHLGLHPSIPATCYPVTATIANSWNEKLCEELGEHLGVEASALGVDVVLGPGLNIKRSPLCGRNFEYFSEDPYLSGKLAAGYCRGLNTAGVTGCLKHFVANEQELRRMSNDSIVDSRTLREIYLTAFEIAVKEGKPLALMTSYNLVNGTYANENESLLQDILRDEWGFEGFVVSDWGGSNNHVAGVIAGSHLEMPGTKYNSPIEIIKALENGSLTEDVLNKRVDEFLYAVHSILRRKADRKAERMADGKPHSPGLFDIDKHHSFAINAARESIVMLKNEDNILPISPNSKVAIIGDFAKNPRIQGSGSSQVEPIKLDTTLDQIANFDLNFIGYANGFDSLKRQSFVVSEETKALAKEADVILLYLGLEDVMETEGVDRVHMRISRNQVNLLESLHGINPNIVVILSCGAPIEMPWLDKCKGLLHGYLSGGGGAVAILDVIVGNTNPSGKLAETYPLALEDIPCHNYYPGKEKTAEYREGIYVGYRYFDKTETPVAFPFGYGLSYTEFSYNNIKVESNKVSFTVKNIGKVAGAEISQLYVGKGYSNIHRANKELKGFNKVFLQPGEKQVVTIPFDEYTFRYYSAGDNAYKIEMGTYQIYIGASSEDIRLFAWIDVEGEEISSEHEMDSLPSYFSGNIKDVPRDEFELMLGRPLPDSRWDRRELLGVNDTISQGFYCKGFIGKLIYRILLGIRKKAFDGEKANINILVVFDMPFRGFAKLTTGIIDMDMAKGIMAIFNGHTFAGASKIKLSFIRKMIESHKFEQKLKYPLKKKVYRKKLQYKFK